MGTVYTMGYKFIFLTKLINCQFLTQFDSFKDGNSFESILSFMQVGEIIQSLKEETFHWKSRFVLGLSLG